jgi:hypothetical protein
LGKAARSGIRKALQIPSLDKGSEVVAQYLNELNATGNVLAMVDPALHSIFNAQFTQAVLTGTPIKGTYKELFKQVGYSVICNRVSSIPVSC